MADQFDANAAAARDKAGGAQDAPQLYWGPNGYGKPGKQNQTNIAAALGAPNGGGAVAGRPMVTVDQANQWLWDQYRNNPDNFNGVRYAMEQAGLNVKSPQDVFQAWNSAVSFAAQAAANGTYINPMEAIGLMKATDGSMGGRRNGTYSKSYSRSETNTQRNVDLSSVQEARAFLMAAAEKELGRAPTSAELAAFRAALNSEERANPEQQVTRSTERGVTSTTYEDGVAVDQQTPNRTVTSSSTTTGGMDRAQYSIDYARSANDWAEYQVATTYVEAMMRALSSPVGN